MAHPLTDVESVNKIARTRCDQTSGGFWSIVQYPPVMSFTIKSTKWLYFFESVRNS